MKTCKKCGSKRFAKVIRKNPWSGNPYETSKCMDCSNKINKIPVAKWQVNNKQHLREYQRKYYGAENRYRIRNSKGNLTYKQRTIGDKSSITEFYKNTPKGYEVDHIIPINGKNVSGLHTRSNLQYLTKHNNRVKSNKI
jgi:DNA-directed RNA polymerase subunit RPC12/RpoP